MAYTITYTPPNYSSLQDDLIYTVAYPEHTIDPATYPNFKFIGDVYVNSVLVARLKRVQDPITGIGVFNISQVVRNYVAAVFNPTGSVLVAQQLISGQFNLTVQIKFGEEYAYTSYYNLVNDSARVFFNSYNGRKNGSTIAAVVNGIASNRPRTAQVMMSNSFFLLPYFAYSGATPSFQVIPTGGGSSFATTFAPTTYAMVELNISPVAINAISPGTITANTRYYDATVNGQTIRVELFCESMYTAYTIHFMNQYGGFESKLFNKVSRTKLDITKKDFGKLPYLVDAAGIPTWYNSNKVYHESRATYSVQYEEKMELNSDLLTDAEYAWLKELVLSPIVYLEDGGYFYPVVIKASDYEVKKYVNEDVLNNLTINVEFGRQLNSQYR